MLVHCESQALKNHKVYALPVLVDGRGIGVAVIIKYIRQLMVELTGHLFLRLLHLLIIILNLVISEISLLYRLLRFALMIQYCNGGLLQRR